MAEIDFYKKYFNINTVDELCETLCATFIESNHTYKFFVNWSKAIANRDVFKYELALLKSLRNSVNPEIDLRKLITTYPEVIKIIPILLAFRDGLVKVLDTLEPHTSYKTLDFQKKVHTEDEIGNIVDFTSQTGLLRALCNMESATDYLLGVEVGLDTNARKNRSGQFLEDVVKEILTNLIKQNPSISRVEQKDFKYVESKYGIAVPPSLRDRKFDNVVIYQGKATNIEVNFYGGTGSKPSEIVSSYINRSDVLKLAGWKFVWLTDGEGWKSMRNPLKVGVENISYVINVNMLRNNILEKILLNQ